MGANCHTKPDPTPTLPKRYWKRTFLTLLEQSADFKDQDSWLQPLYVLVKQWVDPTNSFTHSFTQAARWVTINRLPPGSLQLCYLVDYNDISISNYVNLFDMLDKDFHQSTHPITALLVCFSEQFLSHYQSQATSILSAKQPSRAITCVSKAATSILSFAKVLEYTVVNLYTEIEHVLLAQQVHLFALLLACLVSGKVLRLLEDLAALAQATNIRRLQQLSSRRLSCPLAGCASEEACREAEDLLVTAAGSENLYEKLSLLKKHQEVLARAGAAQTELAAWTLSRPGLALLPAQLLLVKLFFPEETPELLDEAIKLFA